MKTAGAGGTSKRGRRRAAVAAGFTEAKATVEPDTVSAASATGAGGGDDDFALVLSNIRKVHAAFKAKCEMLPADDPTKVVVFCADTVPGRLCLP